MTLEVYTGSAWKYTDTLEIYDGSAWKSVQQAWVYTGSAWAEFFRPVTFSPAGGTSAGSPVELSDYQENVASVVISCSESATWTYSPTIGAYGSGANIASGGSGTTILFSMIDLGGGPQNETFTVSATASGTTRYWTVLVETYGNA
jgi:hypothetical protein